MALSSREEKSLETYREALLELVVVLKGLGAALLQVQDVAEGADHAQVVQANQGVAQAGGLPGRQRGHRAAHAPGAAQVQGLPACPLRKHACWSPWTKRALAVAFPVMPTPWCWKSLHIILASLTPSAAVLQIGSLLTC